MLVQVQQAQSLTGIDAHDLVGRLARVERKQDCDQAAHDMRVAVADKAQARDVAAPIDMGREPDLADTALHLVGGGAILVRQRLELAAKLDHVAVAVFPIVEQLEIGKDLFEARRLLRLIQCVHGLNIGGNGGGCDRLRRQNWGAQIGRERAETFPIARPWQAGGCQTCKILRADGGPRCRLGAGRFWP